MKKNKGAIPQLFLPHKDRLVSSSLFGFQSDKTLVSFVPKKNKAVILLSSTHHNDAINSSTKKPEVIHFYNNTKAGVDALDEKCANYSTSRRTRRWPMVIFYSMLNIASVNSHILYKTAKPNESTRAVFIKKLALELCKPLVCRRIRSGKSSVETAFGCCCNL